MFSKKRTVPGENSCREAVKCKMNSQHIGIFSDSIAKGIRVRQLNKSAKTRSIRIHSFSRAAWK